MGYLLRGKGGILGLTLYTLLLLHDVDCFALQCGFCTPGMILSVIALLNENPDPTEDEIRDYLRGNLCRCTGYNKIIDAVYTAKKYLAEQQSV